MHKIGAPLALAALLVGSQASAKPPTKPGAPVMAAGHAPAAPAPPPAPVPPPPAAVHVHFQNTDPSLPIATLYATDLEGHPFLCTPPCDRDVAPGVPMHFAGEGFPPSRKFTTHGTGPLDIQVTPGSSAQRGGGIAMITIGSILSVVGAIVVVVGLGAGTSVDDSDPCDPIATAGSSPGIIGAGAAVELVGAGLIAGGIVMLIKSKTVFKLDRPELVLDAKRSGPPVLFRF